MSHPGAAEWLGLCLVTESNLPHEWSSIAQVIRNRAEHRRWPESIRDVILEPSQYSHFNPYQDLELEDRELYEAVVAGKKGRRLDRVLLAQAVECARWALSLPPWRAPFGPKVCFYYSPVSMSPPGKAPWWWGAEVGRGFTPPGINPWRFIFGEMKG